MAQLPFAKKHKAKAQLAIYTFRIQVPVGCPIRYRDRIPSYVSEQDIPPASRRLNRDILEHPLSRVSGCGRTLVHPILGRNRDSLIPWDLKPCWLPQPTFYWLTYWVLAKQLRAMTWWLMLSKPPCHGGSWFCRTMTRLL